MKYFIQTLGCAMNYSDSERVAAILEKMGYEKSHSVEESDLYIFNTCSIRQKGEDRVYGLLRNLDSLKKSNPRLLVGITGCMVRNSSNRNTEKHLKDELLKRLDTLDFVFRITDAHKLGEMLAEAEPRLDLPQLEEAEYLESGRATDYLKINPKYSSKFQALVPIQIGCDKYCTYCIVPYARGREKSRPMAEILEECRVLVENGCKEITLIGQTVNSYGLSALDQKSGFAKDIKPGEEPFVTLLTEIDRLHAKGLNRLRFTSPHPRDFTDRLIEAHATLPTLCHNIHLPIQAGNDDVLRRMNRQYTVEKYRTIIDKIRARIPDCSITTDIIVGFCGETEEQFEDTCRVFEEIRWDMAYLSRYSPRVGTVSVKAFSDDVSYQEKARRWHRLNKILETCSQEKNKSSEGKRAEVLVEKFNEQTGEAEGKNREFKIVQFPGTADMVGSIVEVKITKGLQWLLKGEKTAFHTFPL